MSNNDLASEELKQKRADEIAKSATFKTHGVSVQEAKAYLDTPEGKLFQQRLIEADPHTAINDIDRRAISQLTSGRELPRMEIIDEPLVKIVPAGVQDRSLAYSPYFTKPSDLETDVARGYRLHDRLGLPVRSEATVYDVYEIRPKRPTEVFVNHVAPTSELNGQVTRAGGGAQYLVPNRDLFTEATRVASIGNDITLHQELVVGRGLGTPIAAITAESATTQGLRGPVLARSLGAAGLAATAYDALTTHAKASDLHEHGSVLAARSEWNHFAGRNVGGWAGAVAGARLGVVAFGKSPQSAFGGGIAGGIVGAFAGDRIAEREDARQIHNQADRDGVAWNFNGRQWVRQQPGDLSLDGVDNPRKQSFAALPDKARELDRLANNAAFDLAMRDLPQPADPFRLPAGVDDRPSLHRADWQHDPASGQWHRDVVTRYDINELPIEERTIADPQRAQALERQSAEVVAANIANGPAAVAAAYEPLYRWQGWTMPAQMRSLLDDADTLIASDGKRHTLEADGQWRHDGVAATGNLNLELDATRETLKAAQAQHAEAMAGISPRPSLSPREQDRANLAATYASHGVAPIDRLGDMDAVMLAVQRTREANGIDASTTSLALQPDARGGYDINSPLMHLRTDSAGVVQVVAVTSTEDISRARDELRPMDRSEQPAAKDIEAVPPDRISPQTRDAGSANDGSGRIDDTGIERIARLPFGNPEHPQHALYNTLKSALPDYTSEGRLSQFTAEYHLAGIKAHQLESIEVDAGRAVFTARHGWAQAVVDLGAPSPPLQMSLQRAEAFDHEQTQQAIEQGAQRQAAQQQQTAMMQH